MPSQSEEEWVIVTPEDEEFEIIVKTSFAEPFWGVVVNKN
tara:strand:+ start:86 stop:205 length:120 start_codon:yes stop_codon:yes gene_type:complete